MRLLLVEDDPLVGEGLQGFLRLEGHQVDWCTQLSEASLLLGEPFDAWLLDWQLPDGSGVAWLEQQRAKGHTTPALVLTARDQLADRIQGLDSGADDFLVKPFAPEELAARVRAQTRRAAGLNRDRRWGSVRIDLNAKAAWLDEAPVDLTGREWAVLEALLLRAGRLVSGPDLEALVMGLEADVNSNAVQVHVSKLRQKLGRDFIETVRGLGYRIAKPDAGAAA